MSDNGYVINASAVCVKYSHLTRQEDTCQIGIILVFGVWDHLLFKNEYIRMNKISIFLLFVMLIVGGFHPLIYYQYTFFFLLLFISFTIFIIYLPTRSNVSGHFCY